MRTTIDIDPPMVDLADKDAVYQIVDSNVAAKLDR